MPIDYNGFNKQLERALARNAVKNKASAVSSIPALEPVKAELTDEEIQVYIDMMFEASKPKVDKTMEILLKRFPPNQQ